MKKLILFLAILSASQVSFAQQTIEILSVSHQLSDGIPYDSVYNKAAKEQVFNFSATLPYTLNDSTIWYTNLAFENYILQSESTMPNNVANPINVKGISLRTGVIRNLSKDRQLFLFLNPRLSGDLKQVSWKTFQPGVIALLGKTYRRDFAMRFGLAYYQEHTGPFIVPLVYIYRQYSRKFKVSGTLPQDFEAVYKLNRRWFGGLKEFASSRTYHLGDANYRDDYIFRTTVNLSAFVRYKILRDNPLFFELSGGYTYDREYSQFDESEGVKFRIPAVEVLKKDRISKTVGFNDGAFIMARLVFNIDVPPVK